MNAAALSFIALALALTMPLSASGHDGPPFPIVVDEPLDGARVSVWTDPDIGLGTFFVVLEPGDAAILPDLESVTVAVRPESKRLPEVAFKAAPQRVRYGARYYAEVPFDQGEWWTVRIVIVTSTGSRELISRVEATPDGTIGPIGLVVYLLPFLTVGILWLRGFLIHRRREPARSEIT